MSSSAIPQSSYLRRDFGDGIRDTLDSKASELLSAIRPYSSSNSPYSPPSDSAEKAAIVTALDDDIQKLERIRLEVNEAITKTLRQTILRRNAMVPFNALPNEIILHIFHMVVEVAAGLVCTTMLSISQTCARWRPLALSTPSLWAKVDRSILSVQPPDQIIQRSQALPLTQHLCFPQLSHDHKYSLINTCIAYLYKTESIYLNLEDADRWIGWATAPELKHLEVERADHHIHCVPPETFTELFGGSATKLETLSLRSFSAPWSKLVKYTALTKVDLSFTPLCIMNETDFQVPPVSDGAGILDFLRECRRLEEFTLCSSIPLSGPLINSTTCFSLPRLRNLKLLLLSHDLTILLASIRVPSEATVHITDIHVDPVILDANDLPRGVVLPDDPGCLPCFTRLRVLTVDFKAGKISARVTVDDPEPFASIWVYTYEKDDPTHPTFITSMLFQLHARYPLLLAEVLHIRADPANYTTAIQVDPYDFVGIAGCMRGMTVLNLEGVHAITLHQVASGFHREDASKPLYPALRTVVLQKMELPLSVMEEFCQSFFKSLDMRLDYEPGSCVDVRLKQVSGEREVILCDVRVLRSDGVKLLVRIQYGECHREA